MKTEDFEHEELVPQCLEIIRSEQQASVSLFQRRLRLGYLRADAIMDELELRGIVGSSKGAEPRDILVDLDEDLKVHPPKAQSPEPRVQRVTRIPRINANLKTKRRDAEEAKIMKKTKVIKSKPRAQSPAPVEPVPATYVERAAVMNEQERAELRRSLQERGRRIKEQFDLHSKGTLGMINEARGMGRDMELYTGREKLSLPGFESLAPALHEVLPDVTLDFAKRCIMLHQKYPSEIKEYLVADMEWAGLKQLLLNLPASGHGPQLAHAHEPIKDWIIAFSKVKNEYLSLAKELPLEKWGRFFLDSLIREGRPLAELVKKAELLQGSGERRGA